MCLLMMCLTSLAMREIYIKPPTTQNSLGWLWSKRVIISRSSENIKKLKPAYITGEMWNGMASWVNSVQFLWKLKHRLTLSHSNSSPRNWPKRIEIYATRLLYSNVHWNIINSQNVKTIQCPSTLKQTVVYPCNGILFSAKKEKIAYTWYNMNKLQKYHVRPKKKKRLHFTVTFIRNV